MEFDEALIDDLIRQSLGEHQVYRGTFSKDASQQSLQEEINMLRILMKVVLAMAEESDSLAERLRILETFGKSCTRISALIKTERMLAGDRDVATALNQALDKLMDDIGLNPQ